MLRAIYASCVSREADDMRRADILAQVDVTRAVSSITVRHRDCGRHGEGERMVLQDRLTSGKRCDKDA